MPEATNAQVQRYSDERLRPRAEQLIRVLNALIDDRAAIDDVYARLTGSGNWTDDRTDGPPALVEGNDILAYNSFAADLIAYIQTHPNWGVVRAAAVNGLQV